MKILETIIATTSDQVLNGLPHGDLDDATWQNGVNYILGLLGVVAVAAIIYGGYLYMTASGDASKVVKAKNTILYAVVGLIIVILAFAIVQFIVNSVGSGA